MNQTTLTEQASALILPDGPTSEIQNESGKFSALIATYSLHCMNDQFFKQTAMLMALQLSMKAMQGIIQSIFMIFFVVLAAPVGWLADRYAKRQVVIATRWLELIAAVIGAAGVISGSWTVILIAIGLFGFRGAVFSPAINGSIPELIPESRNIKANGIIKVFTTVFLIAGIAAAGVVLDLKGKIFHSISLGHAVIGGGIIILALISMGTSIFLHNRAAASPTAPFPSLNPLESVNSFKRLYSDKMLFIMIFAGAYFWFLGSVLVQLINALGVNQLGYATGRTSYLVAAEGVGIAIGGILSGRLAKGQRWRRALFPCGIAIGVLLSSIALTPLLPGQYLLIILFAILSLAGIAGGLFIIPLESFIQIRPAASEKGSVLASSNVAAFSGMWIAGPAAIPLCKFIQPSLGFAVMGVLTLLGAFWLKFVLPREDIHD